MSHMPGAMQVFFSRDFSTEDRVSSACDGHRKVVEPALQTQSLVVIELINYKISRFAACACNGCLNLKLSY
jgi:hypothetical protein